MEGLSSGLTLITKLQEIQLARKWTDEDMAEQLGCSRQLYQMVRTGKIPPGNKMLKGISTVFPELQQDVIYFLSNDADKSSGDATQNPSKPTSEGQGRGLKRFCMEILGRIRGWGE